MDIEIKGKLEGSVRSSFSFTNVTGRVAKRTVCRLDLSGKKQKNVLDLTRNKKLPAGRLIDLSKHCTPAQDAGTFLNTTDEEHWRLNVLELPDLYVYRPPGGVWPAHIRQAPVFLDEIPHEEVAALYMLHPRVVLRIVSDVDGRRRATYSRSPCPEGASTSKSQQRGPQIVGVET